MLWYRTSATDQASMYEFYTKYIVPFGVCLTDIERKGMQVDVPMLQKVEAMALEDRYAPKFLHRT